jgi:hypothetical protein
MGPEDLERYNITADTIRYHTNYCHIFPPLTNWGFDPNDHANKKVNLFTISLSYCFDSFAALQKKYAGSVWAIIESFSGTDALSELNGEKIHHLGNGFTMDMGLHSMFDDLDLWFEHVIVRTQSTYSSSRPSDALQGDTYRVCTVIPKAAPFHALPPNPTVTFTSTDPGLPLPKSEYLRLHAAVCRIAHMSGVAGYLDLEDRESERRGVLAHDGSSANFLTSRLNSLHIAFNSSNDHR